MIKKAFLFTALLFIAYCFFVQYAAPSWWSATQAVDQQNMVKAQNFIYNEKTYKYVIVGSSLSGRIVGDSLPDAYNLAFGGQSIYDGLRIITSRKLFPRVVLIEMNVVFRGENKEFTSTLLSPLTSYPTGRLRALRADKKPIVVVGQAVVNGIYAAKDFIRGVKPKDAKQKAVVAAVQHSNDTTLSNKMVNDVYKSFFILPAPGGVNNSFAKLKSYVEELKKNDVNVFFYEMPIDNKLEYLPLTKFIRNKFYTVFPKTDYKYIALPGWDYVDTFDGQHLSETAALKYTVYLRGQLNKP